jgi:hypothetical protein
MKLQTIAATTALLTMCSLPSFTQTAKDNLPHSNYTQEREEKKERHPHIRAAIRELQEARRELHTAAHDFGGHRAEALEAVDNAIKQLRVALQYDKR